jgi:membrane-anchored protein YejM (alkaline phosphatase superfamily)
MNHQRNLIALSSWLGFSLAALFLYPLAVALDSSPYYLHSQRRHTAEAFAATGSWLRWLLRAISPGSLLVVVAGDPLRQIPDSAYVRRLSYVDRLLGQVVREMEQDNTLDRSTLAVLSDHGFRVSPREPVHIPFIVKHAGQRERKDITEPVQGEKLLIDLPGSACS